MNELQINKLQQTHNLSIHKNQNFVHNFNTHPEVEQ